MRKTLTAFDACQYVWPGPNNESYYILTWCTCNLQTGENSVRSEVVQDHTSRQNAKTLYWGSPKECVEWLHREILDKLPTYKIVRLGTTEIEPTLAYIGIFYNRASAEDRMKSLNWSEVKYEILENQPVLSLV